MKKRLKSYNSEYNNINNKLINDNNNNNSYLTDSDNQEEDNSSNNDNISNINLNYKDISPIISYVNNNNSLNFSNSQSNLNNESNQNNNLFSFNDIKVTNKFIEHYLNKYNSYQSIAENVLKDEMEFIENVLVKLYEVAEENWENDFNEKFYPCIVEELSSFLKINDRSPEEIIKLMYVLTVKINKIIYYHIEEFTKNESTVYDEIKNNLINELNQEYNNNLKAKLGNNIIKSNSIEINGSNLFDFSKNNINNNNNFNARKTSYNSYNQHIFGNSFDSTSNSYNNFNYINEIAIINKLTIKDCYIILDDLHTSYKVINRFLDHVYSNFEELIIGYNKLLNIEKDINKIFLEEYSILILEDSFFKWVFQKIKLLNNSSLNESFQEILEYFHSGPKCECIAHKTLLVEELREIPPFNLNEKYNKIDDLVKFINSKSDFSVNNNVNNDKNIDSKKNTYTDNYKKNNCSKNKNKGSTFNNKVSNNKTNNKKKNAKKGKNCKINKDPDDIKIDKFRKVLEMDSVPRHLVTKISIDINKDWINNIISK